MRPSIHPSFRPTMYTWTMPLIRVSIYLKMCHSCVYCHHTRAACKQLDLAGNHPDSNCSRVWLQQHMFAYFVNVPQVLVLVNQFDVCYLLPKNMTQVAFSGGVRPEGICQDPSGDTILSFTRAV